MSRDSGARLEHLSDDARRRLVERLLDRRGHGRTSEIVPQPRTTRRFPVSFAQQRMWFLQQFVPETSAFSMGQGLLLRGALDRSALHQSLADVISRHESLRTTFALVDGQPMQYVAPELDIALAFEDARSIDAASRPAVVARAAQHEVRRPWDLATGPLIRAKLWQIDNDSHAFFIGLHHIVSDGWSLGILMKELIESYWLRAAGGAPAVESLPIQYADYSVWQRRWLESDAPSPHLAAWQRLLTGAPRLALQMDGNSDSARDGIGKRVTLSPEVTRQIKALAAAEGVTPFMVLLAAYGLLLACYSRQDDVMIGSPVANRTHPEVENVVGCFMNPLPFRVDLRGNPTFRELMRRAAAVAMDVYAHQQIPFDVLVRMMDPKRESPWPPLYQAMLLFHNFPWEAPRVAASELEITLWPFMAAGSGGDAELVSSQVFPLTLDLVEFGGVITGFLEYTSQLARVLANAPAEFEDLVERFVADPDRRIELPRAALRPAATLADAAPSELIADVYDQFEAQAAMTPDAAAVVDGSDRVTYRELLDRVARLSVHVQSEQITDRPVAIMLERSIDAIAAVLAVLRAGRAYLPLDPALPAERLVFMLRHSGATHVLTSTELAERAGHFGVCAVRVDEASADEGGVRPASRPVSAQLAYVLFTSGSSGRPKAVAISRGALANYVAVARRRFAIGPDDRVLQFASLSFDTAAEEIFPTLTAGATLVLRSDAMMRSVPAFLAAVAEAGITVLDLPTAYWHELTAQIARGSLAVAHPLRLVILGGEKALAPRAREWRAAVGSRVALLNTYGPTESTIVATMWDLTAAEPGSDEPPIGRQVANVEALVLDADMQPVAPGTVGELWIGGAQLARGYLNDPGLTAERFLPHPSSTVPGARLYRTGDLAWARPDGVLVFAGRSDEQVKLRGFRVEPVEIEAAVLQHEAVLETLVTVRPDRDGDARLVAYVALFGGRALDAAELRAFLQSRLPEYMVPAAFVFLDKLPRNVQRKVDRDALPPVAFASAAGAAQQPPRTQLEGRIAALWAEILERPDIGVHDNFFDLGGHSLLAIKLHARLTEEIGADLALIDLFQFVTVSSQAERLAQPAAPAAAVGAAQDRAARQRQAFRRRESRSGSKVAG